MTNETGVILLVEDDTGILRANRRVLEQRGHTVLCAQSLAEARRHIAARPPDVLVLDIMLPDGSGLDFCAEIRDATTAPVLFLTALDERHEIIRGLTAGGNDYIVKPYDIEELAARVASQLQLARAIGRRAAQAPDLSLGPLVLSRVAQRAYLRGAEMGLTPREYAVLLYLAQRQGESVSAERLYREVWRLTSPGAAGAVKPVISRLRRKLAGSGYGITARRGDGYRFGRTEI